MYEVEFGLFPSPQLSTSVHTLFQKHQNARLLWELAAWQHSWFGKMPIGCQGTAAGDNEVPWQLYMSLALCVCVCKQL